MNAVKNAMNTLKTLALTMIVRLPVNASNVLTVVRLVTEA